MSELISSIPLLVILESIFVFTPLQVYQRSIARQIVLRDSAPNTSSVPEAPAPNNTISDDLPIALKKGSRLYTTKYSISIYISLHRASSTLHAFVVSLSSVSIPNT